MKEFFLKIHLRDKITNTNQFIIIFSKIKTKNIDIVNHKINPNSRDIVFKIKSQVC